MKHYLTPRRSGAYPSTWNQATLQQLFAQTPVSVSNSSSTTPASATTPPHQHPSPNPGIIAGVVVASVFGILAVLILLFCLCRHRRRRNHIPVSGPMMPELSTLSKHHPNEIQDSKGLENTYSKSPPPVYCIQVDGGELDGSEVAKELPSPEEVPPRARAEKGPYVRRSDVVSPVTAEEADQTRMDFWRRLGQS